MANDYGSLSPETVLGQDKYQKLPRGPQAVTGGPDGATTIVALTRAAYDALAVKDNNTLYLIIDG